MESVKELLPRNKELHSRFHLEIVDSSLNKIPTDKINTSNNDVFVSKNVNKDPLAKSESSREVVRN